MGFATVIEYLSGAAVYAIGVSLLVVLSGWICCSRLNLGIVALVFSTTFVIFLAISPFPDPDDLDCSEGGVEIQATPFSFVYAVVRLWSSRAALELWLTDVTVTSSIMNVVFFAVVGAVLATQTTRIGAAFLFGLVLSSGIEFFQYTGLLGAYPCRYRTVDVDDLMLNVAGVMLGMLAIRKFRSGMRKCPSLLG